jgi:hypothetical protein
MTAGLRASRAVLLAVNGLGVPVATESVPYPFPPADKSVYARALVYVCVVRACVPACVRA